MALILLMGAFLILVRQPRRPISITVRVLLAAGTGAVGFSYLKLIFSHVYADPLMWSTFWDETMEQIYLLAAWGMLLHFRHSLLSDVTGNWPWRVLKP